MPFFIDVQQERICQRNDLCHLPLSFVHTTQWYPSISDSKKTPGITGKDLNTDLANLSQRLYVKPFLFNVVKQINIVRYLKAEQAQKKENKTKPQQDLNTSRVLERNHCLQYLSHPLVLQVQLQLQICFLILLSSPRPTELQTFF